MYRNLSRRPKGKQAVACWLLLASHGWRQGAVRGGRVVTGAGTSKPMPKPAIMTGAETRHDTDHLVSSKHELHRSIDTQHCLLDRPDPPSTSNDALSGILLYSGTALGRSNATVPASLHLLFALPVRPCMYVPSTVHRAKAGLSHRQGGGRASCRAGCFFFLFAAGTRAWRATHHPPGRDLGDRPF